MDVSPHAHTEPGNIIAMLYIKYANIEDAIAQAESIDTAGDRYMAQFEQSSQLEDLNMAIECYSRAVNLVPNGHIARTIYWNDLGNSLDARFSLSGELSDSDEAIECKTQALLLMPNDSPSRSLGLSNLGNSFSGRFNRLDQLADLDAAVNHHTEAVLLLPDWHQHKPACLNNLGNSLHTRFEHLRDFADLDAAIRHHALAVTLTPEYHPLRSQYHSNLGMELSARFEHLGTITDLHEGITQVTAALLLTPRGHPRRAMNLRNLGDLLHTRFTHLDDLEDITMAIECQTEAVILTSDAEQEQATYLNSLASSLHGRFNRVGKLEDLNIAIQHSTRAVLLTPDIHPDKPAYLNGLGIWLSVRFQRLSEIGDLNAGIDYITAAVTSTPDNSPLRPDYLLNLGNSLLFRFSRLGEISDLNSAIQCHADAVFLMSDEVPEKRTSHGLLGNSLHTRFEHMGDVADLEAAIKHRKTAVQLTPVGHPVRHAWLSNLALSYHARFVQLGELSDLNIAIEHATEAVLLTPEGHPDQHVRLGALAKSLYSRFNRLGELADLDASVEYYTGALVAIPEGHMDRNLRMADLGTSLIARFKRLGELDDLNAAIEHSTASLSLLPSSHPEAPSRMGNIGSALYRRFSRLGELRDLHAAIDHTNQAVLLLTDHDPAKPPQLNNLGCFYATRFQTLGNIEDLNQAIEDLNQAIEDLNQAIEYHTKGALLISEDLPSKPTYLYNLGLSFHTRFERLGDFQDLDTAILKLIETSRLWPEGHPDRLISLFRLGRFRVIRYNHTADANDLVEALSAFRYSSMSLVGTPESKLQASLAWAHISHQKGYSDALEAYSRVIELVPQVAWMGSSVKRRYEHMATLFIIPMEAAAAAIELGRYDTALEWLEGGRSVVWNQLLQLRTPLDDLRSVNAQLADDLEKVACELDSAGQPNRVPDIYLPSQDAPKHTPSEYHRLALRWEKHVDEVRHIPGFERFLLPRQISTLVSSARSGAVVMINIHKSRCDALALCPGSADVIHVPLVSLSYDKCTHMQYQLRKALRGGGVRSRTNRRPVVDTPEVGKSFEVVFRGLWIDVVRPILDALGYLNSPRTAELPRVTWCTTGPLAFLPLHAAGCYSKQRETAFDYVVSSYTPTLSVLLARSSSSIEFSGLLAVGHAGEIGSGYLAEAATELDRIQERVGRNKFTRFTEKSATPSAVLASMKEHSWVHLACHASQNILDPTASAFQLYGGDLDLATITREPLPKAGLAFLSACETATGDESVPDEAVHLAAGMLMSGYRTAIATMWSIRDEDAPIVTEYFYSELFKGGVPDSGKAARALHNAMELLRKRVGEREYLRWVPFIHMGV